VLELRRVDNKDVIQCLDFIATYLLDALAHDNGESTLEEVARELVDGDLDLWLVIDDHKDMCGVVTTGFVYYPRKKSMELRTVTIYADRAEWLPLMATLEDWAKVHQCVDIETTGRLGLEEVSSLVGFKKIDVKMGKVLDYGKLRETNES
jgi:hypothetical protein